ncbi:M17 family peptidase N-terminal domain-containing protein [Demequina sp.]|uniref:leucyl aminopeptidase family protein n=1 Tax=Demequina sp. TaxID=2050685 RepID=UPI0025D1A303|nr:M17 family peptidase N-terminal domain-containing protein [Demequina sp.]
MSQQSRRVLPAGFSPIASLDALAEVTAGAVEHGPRGWIVGTAGDLPEEVGIDRAALAQAGFEGKAGTSIVIPTSAGPQVLSGAGDLDELTVDVVRDAAATAARALASTADVLTLTLPASELAVEAAVAAATEGALLARYRYRSLQAEPKDKPLSRLGVEVAGADAAQVESGIAAGLVGVRAAVVARDLGNSPAGFLTATDMADVAAQLGARFGFEAESFDREQLVALGCGGLLGVNAGSTEEPRMVVLRYTPDGAPTGHLGLVGKGIMYDSGGISLKPSDPMHLLMKIDMGGAAAVMGAFTALRELGTTARVTAWLMCTDNMPSGSATKLGDVLVARNGTTVEVKNTDAEGRLVMMDGLSLAVEEGVDALVDIATLTGAAMMALGKSRAALFATDDALAARVEAAAADVDEPVWRLPLERKYRKQLDSDIADIANLGGPHAGATTAALFLAEFVGETPWAHVDIAGTMQAEADDSWRSTGATGFGARLLARVAQGFSA